MWFPRTLLFPGHGFPTEVTLHGLLCSGTWWAQAQEKGRGAKAAGTHAPCTHTRTHTRARAHTRHLLVPGQKGGWREGRSGRAGAELHRRKQGRPRGPRGHIWEHVRGANRTLRLEPQCQKMVRGDTGTGVRAKQEPWESTDAAAALGWGRCARSQLYL